MCFRFCTWWQKWGPCNNKKNRVRETGVFFTLEQKESLEDIEMKKNAGKRKTT